LGTGAQVGELTGGFGDVTLIGLVANGSCKSDCVWIRHMEASTAIQGKIQNLGQWQIFEVAACIIGTLGVAAGLNKLSDMVVLFVL
jgi:hypothetical protein